MKLRSFEAESGIFFQRHKPTIMYYFLYPVLINFGSSLCFWLEEMTQNGGSATIKLVAVHGSGKKSLFTIVCVYMDNILI